MSLPFLAPLRKTLRNHAFVWRNPDVRRVVGQRGASSSNGAASPAPLSPAQLAQWNDNGFLVLKGFLGQDVVQDYKRHIDTLWRQRARADNPLVMYSVRGEHYFRDAIDTDRQQTYRLLDHYLMDAPTRAVCMDQRLIGILHHLMGHRPVVCNSLLFEYGSEQEMHSDMFYMPPVTENQMLATWIAIDDVTDDNGPLLYVPGSHKLPPHRFSNGHVHAVTEEVSGAVAAIQEKMSALGLKTEKFMAKSGDVLIWHSQLMHGGDAIRDPSARRTSLVTHYFSTRDVPVGPWRCAERTNGSLFLMKEHVPIG